MSAGNPTGLVTSGHLQDGSTHLCWICGADMFLTETGVSHHAGETFEGVDHGADADHTALATCPLCGILSEDGRLCSRCEDDRANQEPDDRDGAAAAGDVEEVFS